MWYYYFVVPKKGLEPSRLTALDPKSSVSTNSTTSAHKINFMQNFFSKF